MDSLLYFDALKNIGLDIPGNELEDTSYRLSDLGLADWLGEVIFSLENNNGKDRNTNSEIRPPQKTIEEELPKQVVQINTNAENAGKNRVHVSEEHAQENDLLNELLGKKSGKTLVRYQKKSAPITYDQRVKNEVIKNNSSTSTNHTILDDELDFSKFTEANAELIIKQPDLVKPKDEDHVKPKVQAVSKVHRSPSGKKDLSKRVSSDYDFLTEFLQRKSNKILFKHRKQSEPVTFNQEAKNETLDRYRKISEPASFNQAGRNEIKTPSTSTNQKILEDELDLSKFTKASAEQIIKQPDLVIPKYEDEVKSKVQTVANVPHRPPTGKENVPKRLSHEHDFLTEFLQRKSNKTVFKHRKQSAPVTSNQEAKNKTLNRYRKISAPASFNQAGKNEVKILSTSTNQTILEDELDLSKFSKTNAEQIIRQPDLVILNYKDKVKPKIQAVANVPHRPPSVKDNVPKRLSHEYDLITEFIQRKYSKTSFRRKQSVTSDQEAKNKTLDRYRKITEPAFSNQATQNNVKILTTSTNNLTLEDARKYEVKQKKPRVDNIPCQPSVFKTLKRENGIMKHRKKHQCDTPHISEKLNGRISEPTFPRSSSVSNISYNNHISPQGSSRQLDSRNHKTSVGQGDFTWLEKFSRSVADEHLLFPSKETAPQFAIRRTKEST